MMAGFGLQDAVEILADEIRRRGLMAWLNDRPIISMTLHEQYPDIHTRWAGYHVWLFYSRSSQRAGIMLKENPLEMEEKANMDISMDWAEFKAGLMLAAVRFFAGEGQDTRTTYSVGHKPGRAGQ